jgi:DNA-binding LacI/PurR family transcriptional regulator
MTGGFNTKRRVRREGGKRPAGARRGTVHLLDHGYRRIGHLAGPQKSSVGKERLLGFRRAMVDYGVPVDETLIVEAGIC